MKNLAFMIVISMWATQVDTAAQNSNTDRNSPTVRLQGKVTDAISGEPVDQARIIFPKTDQGTLSGKDGTFEIPLKAELNVIPIMAKADGYQDKWLEQVLLDSEAPRPVMISLQPVVKNETRVFEVKNRDVVEIARILKAYAKPEHVSTSFGTITFSTSARTMAKLDSLVTRLDAPVKRYLVEVRLVRPKLEATASMREDELLEWMRNLPAGRVPVEFEEIGRAAGVVIEGKSLRMTSQTSTPEVGDYMVRVETSYSDEVIALTEIEVLFQKAAGANITTSLNLENGETVALGAAKSRGDAPVITLLHAEVVAGE